MSNKQEQIEGYDFCRRCRKVHPAGESARMRFALSTRSAYSGTNGEIVLCPECAEAVGALFDSRIQTVKSLPGTFVHEAPELPAVSE